MTPHTSEDPDAAIDALLPKLSDFLADADEVLTGEAGGWIRADEVIVDPESPLALTFRIKAEAGHLYLGVLRVTNDALAAPSAPVLVRSLLECWAHALWIAEGVPRDGMPTSSAGRAVCLELGMASELVKNLKKSSAEAQLENAKADAEAWLQRVKEDHARTACQCEGRTHRDVQATLKFLRDTTGMNWPYDTWVSASAAGHILMPQRLARRVGDDLEWGGPASAVDRMNWLHRGTVCAVNVYLYVIGTLRREKVGEYDRLAHALLDQLRGVHTLVHEADARIRSRRSSARSG